MLLHHSISEKLIPLTEDELDLYLGKVVYKASRGHGPHWLMEEALKDGVLLITPVTRADSTATYEDLRRTKYFQKLYF